MLPRNKSKQRCNTMVERWTLRGWIATWWVGYCNTAGWDQVLQCGGLRWGVARVETVFQRGRLRWGVTTRWVETGCCNTVIEPNREVLQCGWDRVLQQLETGVATSWDGCCNKLRWDVATRWLRSWDWMLQQVEPATPVVRVQKDEYKYKSKSWLNSSTSPNPSTDLPLPGAPVHLLATAHYFRSLEDQPRCKYLSTCHLCYHPLQYEVLTSTWNAT